MSSSVTPARSRVPRLAEAAVARARLTVVPRHTNRVTRVPFLALVSLLLVGGVAGLLLFNTSLQQASFTATALEQRANMLDAKAQALQMQLARLQAPQRLAERAKHLGMVPPSNPAFIRLSDGAVLGKPQPATTTEDFRIAPPPVGKPADLSPAPIVVTVPPSTDPSTSQAAGDTAASSRNEHASAGRKKPHPQRAQHRRARHGQSQHTQPQGSAH
ncbi:MAG TPA: hypothetical protein VFJ09_14900 [Nocardioidaceae bacterium]|nr:hypothetical protein [Nocardioidaceae bacterium]